jgi:hypothetical protein
MCRRLVSLGGVVCLGFCGRLGERRPRLASRLGRYLFDFPRDSGEGEGERPRFWPWARGPLALSMPRDALASCSSSLMLADSRKQGGEQEAERSMHMYMYMFGCVCTAMDNRVVGAANKQKRGGGIYAKG